MTHAFTALRRHLVKHGWTRQLCFLKQKQKWNSTKAKVRLSTVLTSTFHQLYLSYSQWSDSVWYRRCRMSLSSGLKRSTAGSSPAARCESPAAVSRRLFLLLFFNSHRLIWGVNCYLLLLCSDSLQQPEGWTHLCCSSHLSVSPCVLSVSSDSLIKENAKNKRSAARF